MMEAAAAMGGKDMVPFYSLIDGGRDGNFYRVSSSFFLVPYYRLADKQTTTYMQYCYGYYVYI